MEDELILKLALKSNDPKKLESTFNYFFNKYKNLVIFVSSSYLKNKEDALDVTQDTFVQFIKNSKFVISSVKSYLTKTARNLSLNLLKSKSKVFLSGDEDELNYLNNLNEENHNEDFILLLSSMKNVLSDDDIKIVLMHLVFGYTFLEISKKLNTNEKTINSKYYRALKKVNKLGGI